MIYQSSPNCSIDRTFQVKFTIPTFTRIQKEKESKSQKQYANPIILAIKWQEAINRGEYSSPADLSRKLRISRARVTQFLRLLHLDSKVLQTLISLNDPLPSPIITKRKLRSIVALTAKEQKKLVDDIISE